MFSKIHNLLPWYINNTLTEEEQQQVTESLRKDAETQIKLTNWQMIADALINQTEAVPSPNVRKQLLKRIQQEKRQKKLQTQLTPQAQIQLVFSFFFVTLAVFLSLWYIIQPGIMLEWSVTSADETNTYHVYRSLDGSSNFELVGELTAKPGLAEYSYVDIWLLPGRTFTYFVEGINQQGQIASSQVVTGNTLIALPNQLALLAASIFFTAFAFTLVKHFHHYHNANILFR